MENLRPCLVHTASFDGLLVGRFTRTSRRISKDSTQRHTFRHTSTAVTWSPGCVVRNQSENLRRNGSYSIHGCPHRSPATCGWTTSRPEFSDCNRRASSFLAFSFRHSFSRYRPCGIQGDDQSCKTPICFTRSFPLDLKNNASFLRPIPPPSSPAF